MHAHARVNTCGVFPRCLWTLMVRSAGILLSLIDIFVKFLLLRLPPCSWLSSTLWTASPLPGC